MGSDYEKFSDDSPPWLIWLNDALHMMLPFVLVVLIVYLFIRFFTSFYHPVLTFTERFVLGYFVIELIVAFILYNSKKKFLKDKWFHILLVLPMFAVFRVVGRVFQVFRGGAVALEGVRALQIFEAGMMHQLFGGYRITRLSIYLAEIQKGLHAIVDLPKVIGKKKIKWLVGVGGIGFFERYLFEDDKKEISKDGDEEKDEEN